MTCKHFPQSPADARSLRNPAIQLFGNRLYSDQTINELLSEFLLVACSSKKLETGDEFETALPSTEQLSRMSNSVLYYSPKARLNLKLFSFLGNSRLDSRHYIHRSHHNMLIEELKKRIELSGSGTKDDVVRSITNLLLGFQGAGSGRTWCTQSFLPISKGLLARESIWKASKAKTEKPEDWYGLLKTRSSFFDMNQHLFYARGGELLYLQICNSLRQKKEKIEEWSRTCQLGLTKDELDPSWLHQELERGLGFLMEKCPSAISLLCEFIDIKLDPETPYLTDGEEDIPFCAAGWCNEGSWREGYMFATELNRVLKTELDIIEKVRLLETVFAMHSLRTLAAQSARITRRSADWLGYRLVISSPIDRRSIIRRQSQYSVKRIQKMIYDAVRSDAVHLPTEQISRDNALRTADKKYGCKLFVRIAKKIGMIIPKRGGGERFILNDDIIRYLVITTIPLGGNLTYDYFKILVENRHGLVFDALGIERAGRTLFNAGSYYSADTDVWVLDMLEASGCLVKLSDSCALVKNPTAMGRGKQ